MESIKKTFNCGLLIIRDREFRKLYIDRWKTLHQFCKERMDIFSNKHFNELRKTNNEYLGTLTNYYTILINKSNISL